MQKKPPSEMHIFPNTLKYNFSLYFLTLCLSLICVTPTQGQSTEHLTLFDSAMLDLAQNKVENATLTLQNLYENDTTNMNYAYLLGKCYLKLDTQINKAVTLLESAITAYSPDYTARDPKERRVSEYAYYYLLVAYTLNGDCSKTLSTLNKFYSIYSYSNEYYLVNGQRYHRACIPRKSPIIDPIAKDALEIIQEEDSAIINQPQKNTYALNKEKKNAFWVSTKSVHYTNRQPTYGVQIAATLTPQYTWEFKVNKNIEVYIDEHDIYRYIIGDFINIRSAERLLQVIKDAGYTDAFVVNTKNKNLFSERVVSMDHKPINDVLIGKVFFTVQVGAYKSDDVPEDLLHLFVTLEDVSEIPGNEWTYLTVGEFANEKQARFYLELVQDLGIKDSFITAFNYNRKIDLRQAQAYLLGIKSSKNSKDEDKKKSKDKKNKSKNKKNK